MTYSMETMYEIWNDKSGDCIEIGPDRDGLGLIEIRDKQSKNVSLVLEVEQAELVILALQKAVASQKNKNDP